MYLSKTRKIQLEEQYNLLLTEPRIQELRSRASRWVFLRLARIQQIGLLEELGITAVQWRMFQQGQDPKTAELVLKHTGLSRERTRQYRLLEKADPETAATWLIRQMLEREQRDFYTRIGISRHAWERFVNCSAYTNESTIDQIVQGLSLTPEEEQEFRALVFRDTFEVTGALKEKIRGEIAEQNVSISQFLERAELSENAWVPFGSNTKKLPTSQQTLLKLILGTEMNEAEGRSFLNLVQSDFVMRRDLAVLLCIQAGIYDKAEIYYVLEFFARGYGKERFFRNLYADPGLE